MNYLPHEIANLFPMMLPHEFVSLKADIKERGLKSPVIMFEGKILDGRNRFKACQEVGAEIKTVDYDGDDALADSISWNLKRRHLDEGQRGMVAAKLANMVIGDNQHVGASANLRTHQTSQAEAAQMLNVSERTVSTAKQVEKHGIPELVEKAEQGAVSVSSAAKISSLDDSEQKEIIEKINLGEKPAQAIKNHIEKKTGLDHPFTNALQFSSIAISQLSRIEDGDPKRVEALTKVLNYINKQLKENK